MGNFRQRFIFVLTSAVRLYLESLSYFISLFIPSKMAAIPIIKNKILLTPAISLSEQIKRGTLTSEQVVQAFISQVERVNPIINAMIDKRFKRALEEARQIDKRLIEARRGAEEELHLLQLPLIGVPMSVKETVMLEGSTYTAGLPRRKNLRANKSNPAVKQLVESGIIPIGSTNTPCMNMWWDSYNNLNGRTKNPYDLYRIVGGSSGGEAALLAAAGSVIGVGSDYGGSIRIPANFCGVFGHKPSPLSVNTEGMFPETRAETEVMRAVGPMTRYSVDLVPMLKIMLKEGEAAKMKLDEPVDLSKIKVFYCEDLGDFLVSKCNKEVLTRLQAAVEHLSAKFSVPVQKIKFDNSRAILTVWSAEMRTKDGPKYAPEYEHGLDKINSSSEIWKWLIGRSDYPITTIILSYMEQIGPQYGDRKQKLLSKRASDLRMQFLDIVEDNGILIMPTHPEPAPCSNTTLLKCINCSWATLANILHCPATQCPLGMSRRGLPIGLQVLSKPYNDRVTLAVAREFERAFGGWQSPAKAPAS